MSEWWRSISQKVISAVLAGLLIAFVLGAGGFFMQFRDHENRIATLEENSVTILQLKEEIRGAERAIKQCINANRRGELCE